jgi:DNA-binding response OmpR family regulator
VAAASSTSSGTVVSRPSVLFLEEYDALVAAIGSALKKFAPQHAVAVARSLGEAEKLANETKPELFVMDVDPQWIGLTDFLERMRATFPNSRVLVIGAPIPAEIATARGLSGALQFIEKPFELAKFGASVQALLGPWQEFGNGRGTLGSLGPADIVLTHRAATANVVVDVSANAKDFGELHFARGELIHAETRKLRGEDALREVLSWSQVRMRETKESPSTKRTVSRDWTDVLAEVLRAAKAIELIRISPAEEAPAKPRSKTGKKIVIVDDTDMLLIFAEDILTTADPELQITTAMNGADGVKKVETVLPDLVLLDYSLPDFNGDEVCRRLLQNERTAGVPILMMSGHVPEMNATAARHENVVATIEKPFLSDALVDLVQKTLQGKRQPRPKIVESPPPPAPKVFAPAPPPIIKQKPEPPVPKPAPQPAIIKPVPRTLPQVETAAAAVPVIATAEREAVLGLFLEVLSMQLTSELQMGAIRAKPASSTVSLQLPAAARSAIPAELGFQLGTTALDENGRISTLCLIPTAKPFQPSPTRSAFEIGGVSVIPNPARARVQLTPAGTTPMTIELIANLEIAAVELSDSFQVARLVLKWKPNSVRVTLNPKAPPQSAARFDATSVKLDNSARIAELLLHPVK